MRFSLQKEMELGKTTKGIEVRLAENGGPAFIALVDVGSEFMRQIGDENMKSSNSKGKGKGNNSCFWREAG